MNSTLKGILIFVSGAAAGAAGMWFGVSTYYRIKSDKAIDEMSDYYEKTYRPKKDIVNKTIKTVKEDEVKKVQEIDKALSNSYEKSLEDRTNYHKISESIDEKGSLEVLEDHPNEDEFRGPYVISDEEYGSSIPYYTKKMLLYNKTEHCLIDRELEEELDIDKTLGMTIYDMLEDMKDKTWIYVRNDMESTDYEIEVRDFGDDEDDTYS